MTHIKIFASSILAVKKDAFLAVYMCVILPLCKAVLKSIIQDWLWFLCGYQMIHCPWCEESSPINLYWCQLTFVGTVPLKRNIASACK